MNKQIAKKGLVGASTIFKKLLTKEENMRKPLVI